MILSDDIKYMISNLSSKPILKKKVSAKPIVSPSLMEISSYEIKFALDNESKLYRNLNMMEIRPIELDASILFYNKRNKEGPLLPIPSIREIKKLSKQQGIFNKKERLVVEISFENQDKEKKIVRIEIEENKIDGFLQQIKDIQDKLQNNENFSATYSLTYRSETGEISSIEIFPYIPFLSDDEEIIWKNIITKKGIKGDKKVDYIDLVTNYRIFHHNYTNHQGSFILINQIKDVAVDNIKYITKSDLKDLENESENFRVKKIKENNNDNDNNPIGDITITSVEKYSMVFKDISDPNRVVNTIKLLKNQCKFSIGKKTILPFEMNKRNSVNTTDMKRSVRSNGNVDGGNDITGDQNTGIIQSLSIQDNIVCNNCKKINTANSNFCNMCGEKLKTLRECIKCNYPNFKNAIFCNICGNKL